MACFPPLTIWSKLVGSVAQGQEPSLSPLRSCGVNPYSCNCMLHAHDGAASPSRAPVHKCTRWRGNCNRSGPSCRCGCRWSSYDYERRALPPLRRDSAAAVPNLLRSACTGQESSTASAPPSSPCTGIADSGFKQSPRRINATHHARQADSGVVMIASCQRAGHQQQARGHGEQQLEHGLECF